MTGKLIRLSALAALAVFATMRSPTTVVQADPPPTFGYGGATPTLGSIRWDCRGGEAALGEPSGGGNGGGLGVIAPNGAVLHDDNRARPSGVIGANAFAPALGDNKVTFAEISAMPGWNALSETLELASGYGVYLPANATLDLSDTPVGGTVVYGVRIVAPDDVIVLAGTVKTGRNDYDSVFVELRSDCPPSTSAVGIVFTGTLNLDGKTGWGSTGAMLSASGDVLALGSVTARGGQASFAINQGTPGNGGGVTFESDAGDVLLANGSVEAGAGKGANGGNLYVVADSTGGEEFDWGLRANGGDVDGDASGGNGGYFYAEFRSSVNFRVRVVANGGDSPVVSGGGIGGGANLTSHGTGSGHLFATVDGGNESGLGGGAAITVSEMSQTTLSGSAKGGDGGDYGGSGGAFFLSANSIFYSLVDADCDGGNGSIGGHYGGNLSVSVDSQNGDTLEITGLKVNFKARGGEADEYGGYGGTAYIGAFGRVNASVLDLDIDVSGGQGGISRGLGGLIDISSSMENGELSGDFKLTSQGAVGGEINLYFLYTGGTFAGEFDLDASGNDPQDVSGGNGGHIRIQPNWTAGDFGSVTGSLNASVRGGHGVGEDSHFGGGNGGTVELSCGIGGEFSCSHVDLDLRGGNADWGVGGGGGDLFASFLGDATLASGNIRLEGGKGGTVEPNGGGGNGGSFSCSTDSHTVTIGATISGSGGAEDNDSGTGIGAGNGAIVVFNLNSDQDASGGSLVLSGNCNLRGGNSHQTSGGNGGSLSISDGVASAGGAVTISGTINLTGGNSLSPANSGGLGGTVVVDVAASILISGLIVANGGNATQEGGIGGPGSQSLNVGNNRAATVHLTGSAVIRANGGAGDTAAERGAGGNIALDPAGSGPSNPNLVEDSGSVITVTGVPTGTITRD